MRDAEGVRERSEEVDAEESPRIVVPSALALMPASSWSSDITPVASLDQLRSMADDTRAAVASA